MGVCYLPVPRGTPRPPQPVDPRPEGIGLLYLLDGYPVSYSHSPTFQHLVTARSVKQLTFVVSHEAATMSMGSLSSGGIVADHEAAPSDPSAVAARGSRGFGETGQVIRACVGGSASISR
jgi:hypothetical protein